MSDDIYETLNPALYKHYIETLVWTSADDFKNNRDWFKMDKEDYKLFLGEMPISDFAKLLHERSVELGKNVIVEVINLGDNEGKLIVRWSPERSG